MWGGALTRKNFTYSLAIFFIWVSNAAISRHDMPRRTRQATIANMEASPVPNETSTDDTLVMPALDGTSANRITSTDEDKGVIARGNRRTRNKRIIVCVTPDGTVDWDASKDAKEKLSEVAQKDPSLAAVVGASNPSDLPDDVVVYVTNGAMMPIGAAAAIIGPKLSPDIAKCPVPISTAIQTFSVSKEDFSEAEMDAAKRVLTKRGPAWFMAYRDELMWAGVLTKSLPKKFELMVEASKKAYLEAHKEIEASKRPNGSTAVPLHRTVLQT